MGTPAGKVEYVDIRYSSHEKSYFNSNVLAFFIKFDKKMLFSTMFITKWMRRKRDQPFSGEVVLCMFFYFISFTSRWKMRTFILSSMHLGFQHGESKSYTDTCVGTVTTASVYLCIIFIHTM